VRCSMVAAGIGIATPDGAFQDAGEVAQASLRTTELSSVPEDRFCDIAASDCVLRRFASRPGLLNQCGLTTRWLLPVVHAAGVSTEPRGAGWMIVRCMVVNGCEIFAAVHRVTLPG
jgi:hypothetical protein